MGEAKLSEMANARRTRLFGRTRGGDDVYEYCLTNDQGVTATMIDYGATITSLNAPDREGRFGSIVLGYETLRDYEDCPFYIGSVIGRYAGRIRNGSYVVNGAQLDLEKNHDGHHLHGGSGGFHKKVWRGATGVEASEPFVEFSCEAKDGEGGHAGDVSVIVRYTLGNDNRLVVDYRAEASAPTHLNLTQHSYFNLSADSAAPISDHTLETASHRYLETDGDNIPSGRILPVEGTPYDFRFETPIGEASDWLDDDFVLDRLTVGVRRAGSVAHQDSGRALSVWTDQPALHVYTGQHLGGAHFNKSSGLCLEAQAFPNAPNMPAFPSTRYGPGEAYFQRTIFQFSTLP